MPSHSSHELLELVQQFGCSIIVGGPYPPLCNGPEPDREFGDLDFWYQEEIAVLDAARKTGNYDIETDAEVADVLPDLKSRAADFIASEGLNPTPDELATIREGVARAMIEERRQRRHRLRDRLIPYEPVDPLFTQAWLAASKKTQASPTFQEAAAAYVAAKAGVIWSVRTEQDNKRILGLAGEHFGPAKRLAEITKDDVRGFRDGVTKWQSKPSHNAPLKEISDAALGDRISAVTARKYFGFLTAAFNYWIEEGYLDVSPAGKLSVKKPKNKQAGAREPFNDKDLATLFGSPMFTACAGPTRRMEPGPHALRDGYYWIPLVAALAGMRVTEIVQLLIADVDLDAAVPSFRIKADAEAGQSVKSTAGWRSVPVHRRLIELGFLNFVADRRAINCAGRIFSDVPMAKTSGGPGSEFSKWFGRRMTSLKLKRAGLVFHSFRHRFIDELREAGTPSYIIKAIVGHEGGDVTDGYGSKPSLTLCKQWIDKITILDVLPPTPVPLSPG